MAPASITPAAPATFDLASSPLEPGITLIQASAGTGKTFTIAGLFVRLLVEKSLRVEQILVVTYTVAATAELRDRIRRALADAVTVFRLTADGLPLPPQTAEHVRALVAARAADAHPVAMRLEEALASFDQAAIFTIHGFCQRALRDRAFESGQLFDMELRADATELQLRTLADFWRRRVLTAGGVPLAVVLGEFATPAKLLKELQPLLAQAELELLPPPEHLPFETQRDALCSAYEALAAEWQARSATIRSQFGAGCGWVNAPYNNDAKVGALFEGIERALSSTSPSSDDLGTVAEFTTAALAAKAPKKPKAPRPDLRFFQLCDAFAEASKRWLIALRQTGLQTLRDALPRLKAELKVQSFDDLLGRLDHALNQPGGDLLANALREQFGAALIDEFQDTDPLQFRIFRRVFDGQDHALFLIGDPKQAIYGFRGADIFTYLDAAAAADRDFTLRQNFRSEQPLVEAVNTLFAGRREAFVFKGIPFHRAIAAGRADDTPLTVNGSRPSPLQVWFMERTQRDLTQKDAQRAMPPAIAAEVVRLLQSDARIGERPLQPQDLAVLLPENRQAALISAELARAGVPAVLQTTASLFDAPEVGEMRRLLAAIHDPTDASLRSAMTTCALGMDAATLLVEAANDASWQALSERFRAYRNAWDEHGVLPMFRLLVQREAIRPNLLALEDGERRLTNLLHLAEVLQQTASERELNRSGLWHWLAAESADPSGNDAYQLRLDRDEQAVRIVTIHRSKGLEYAVVFCPFSWKGVLGKNRKTPALFHQTAESEGAARAVFDFGSDEYEANLARAQEEKLAEQVRQLYVALTRARHRCYLAWGGFGDAGTSALAWLLGSDESLNPFFGPDRKVKAPPPDAELRAALQNWQSASGGAVEIFPPPSPALLRYTPPADAGVTPSCRTFGGHIRRDWRISSFTSLTSDRSAEMPDYDAEPATPKPEEPLKGIFAFPRGARAGSCLHRIFEQVDFVQPDAPEITSRIVTELRVHGLDSQWRDDLARMVETVLRVDLPGRTGRFHLADIPGERRLNELEFQFPVGRLQAERLNAFLHQHGGEGGRLRFEPVTGLIKGFMDLVLEFAGQFYLVDWKSNWLGACAADYGPQAMTQEMRHQHYDLQYRLYTVALDKFLRSRVPGYDYETHFGGVFYLFLRGVDAQAPGCGVFAARPEHEFVNDLAGLLESAS